MASLDIVPDEKDLAPDFVPALKELGLLQTSTFFNNLSDFLLSAASQPAEHLAGLALLLTGEARKKDIPSPVLDEEEACPLNITKDRTLVGMLTKPDDSDVAPYMRFAWGYGDYFPIYTQNQVAPFKFVLRANVQDSDNVTVKFHLDFRDFFTGPALVNCIHRCIGELTLPDKRLCNTVTTQFPNFTNVLLRLSTDRPNIHMVREIPFTPAPTPSALGFSALSKGVSSRAAAVQGLGCVNIVAPLDMESIEKHYPGLYTLFTRISFIKVDLTNEAGDQTIMSWGISPKSKLFFLTALKLGDKFVWSHTPPASGKFAEHAHRVPSVHLPVKLFSWDLTSQPDLMARVDLSATILGLDIQLPKFRFRMKSHVVAPGKPRLVLSVESIEPTMLTKAATTMMGIGDIFDLMKSSFTVALTIDATPEHVASPLLNVAVNLTLPKSRLAKAFMVHKLEAYIERWMGLLTLFYDMCHSLKLDVEALHASDAKPFA